MYTQVHKNILFCLMLSFVLFVSCNSHKKSGEEKNDDNNTEIETTHVTYEDSTIYAHVSITGDLPLAKNDISTRICDTLFALLDMNLGDSKSSAKRVISPYTSSEKDWQEIVTYYGKGVLKNFSYEANVDEEEILSFSDDDYFPRWEYDMKISKTKQYNNYVVFNCNEYLYMGGAHGGSNSLDIVFDLRDGSRFTNFFKPNIVHHIQPLLRKGLVEYFSTDTEPITDSELNEHLLIEGSEIPLPEDPCPSEKGLTFVYGEYAIACYAAGKPSFTIPYHDLIPFLTDEAKDLLDLKEENE